MASGYVILPGLTQTSTQCWSWRKKHKGLEGLFHFTGGDFNHRTLQLCFDGQSEGQGLNLEKSLDLRNHEITMRFRLSFGDLFINMQKWENDWLNIWNLARISAIACDPVFFLSFLHQSIMAAWWETFWSVGMKTEYFFFIFDQHCLAWEVCAQKPHFLSFLSMLLSKQFRDLLRSETLMLRCDIQWQGMLSVSFLKIKSLKLWMFCRDPTSGLSTSWHTLTWL